MPSDEAEQLAKERRHKEAAKLYDQVFSIDPSA